MLGTPGAGRSRPDRRSRGDRGGPVGDPAVRRDERPPRAERPSRAERRDEPPTREQAHDACLRLLATRARSRRELAQRLHTRGCEPAVAEEVLDRLAAVGLVDDAAFADSWVRQRHEHSGRGRRALAHELRGKGVADETAATALAQVDDEAEQERARELVARKLRSRDVPPPGPERTALVRRLVGMLARRGFAPGAALAVVRAELAAADPGSDPDAALDGGPDHDLG